jgi:signal peptidase I
MAELIKRFKKTPEQPEKAQTPASGLYEWVESFIKTVVVVVFVFTFFARTSVVQGGSMENTLQEGEMLLVTRFLYTPVHGDIVVATKPTMLNEPLVKRIIAMGGQTVDIDFGSGIVKVDGIELDESYVNTPTNKRYDLTFPVTVPKGQLFVMGDNRNGSLDSRSSKIGFIDERYILGKVFWRILPLSHFGSL